MWFIIARARPVSLWTEAAKVWLGFNKRPCKTRVIRVGTLRAGTVPERCYRSITKATGRKIIGKLCRTRTEVSGERGIELSAFRKTITRSLSTNSRFRHVLVLRFSQSAHFHRPTYGSKKRHFFIILWNSCNTRRPLYIYIYMYDDTSVRTSLLNTLMFISNATNTMKCTTNEIRSLPHARPRVCLTKSKIIYTFGR